MVMFFNPIVGACPFPQTPLCGDADRSLGAGADQQGSGSPGAVRGGHRRLIETHPMGKVVDRFGGWASARSAGAEGRMSVSRPPYSCESSLKTYAHSEGYVRAGGSIHVCYVSPGPQVGWRRGGAHPSTRAVSGEPTGWGTADPESDNGVRGGEHSDRGDILHGISETQWACSARSTILLGDVQIICKTARPSHPCLPIVPERARLEVAWHIDPSPGQCGWRHATRRHPPWAGRSARGRLWTAHVAWRV
jgi:hypothetical protein